MRCFLTMSHQSNIYSYRQFKDSHKGETCVIIGNGPSLRDVDDAFLYKYPTFGTNLIVMRENFAPTYYSGIGYNHFDTLERAEAVWGILDHPNLKAAFINRLVIHMYRHPKVWSILAGNTYGEPNWEKTDDDNIRIRFGTDPLNNVGVFATTIYVQIQLAAYMGFTTALLVGLDHYYDVDDSKGQHFYEEGTQEAYDPPDYPWDITEEYSSKADIAYRVSLVVGEQIGLEFINLTPGSLCDVFDMGNIDDWR